MFPIIEKNTYLMQKPTNSPQKKREDLKLPSIERNHFSGIGRKQVAPLKVNKSSELIEMSSLSAKNYLNKRPVFSNILKFFFFYKMSQFFENLHKFIFLNLLLLFFLFFHFFQNYTKTTKSIKTESLGKESDTHPLSEILKTQPVAN